MKTLINNFTYIKDTLIQPPHLVEFTQIDGYVIYIQNLGHYLRNSNLYVIFDNESGYYRCIEYQTIKSQIYKDLNGYILYFKNIKYHLTK